MPLIAARSLRSHAIAAAREHAEGCVVVLQGKLADDTIAEAGIAVQLKAPKPTMATAESAPESAAEPAPA